MLFEDFQGFKTVKELRVNGLDCIPDRQGVYLVLFKGDNPGFLDESIGGHFKGRNPTVPVPKLESKWIKGVEVIYIGQAGGGNSQATLRKRIRQYLQFGAGKPVGHWGGRYIWQLERSDELVFAWKSTEDDPNVVESNMINNFRNKYGDRPFANLTK